MTERPDALQSLVDTLNFERDTRTTNLAHTIKLLRGTVLMLEALLQREHDDLQFANLDAIRTQVQSILLWQQEHLDNEVERQADPSEKGEDKTIH